MTIALDDILKPPTSAEIRAGMYAWLDANGVSTTMWIVGAVTRAVVSAAAMFIAGGFYLISLIARGGFRTLAAGDWLTLCAADQYGVPRVAATYATVTCTLTNSGGGIYADVQPGDVKYAIASGEVNAGAVFENAEEFDLVAPGSVSVVFRAVASGSTSSASVGTITEPVSGLSGVTCTNPTAAVGVDAQGDPALRDACSAKLDSVSPNGARDVYRYWAPYALREDGTELGITRCTVSEVSATSTVTLYLARDAEGLSAPDLESARVWFMGFAVPNGVTLVCDTATPVEWSGTYYIAFPDNENVPRIEPGDATDLVVQEWIVDYFASVPIGGFIYSGNRQKVTMRGFEQAIAAAYESTSGLPRSWEAIGARDGDYGEAGDLTLAVNEFVVIGTITPFSGT